MTKSYSYSTSNPEEVVSTSITGRPTTYYGYDGAGDTTSISNTSSLKRQLSYDAQARLVQVTLGSPITQTVALAYNAFGQRAGYSVTPTGAGQPSLSESFTYQGDQLSQVATTGTGITTPYTDTYVYTQDGTPLELLRQTSSSTIPYWYVLDGQSTVKTTSGVIGNTKLRAHHPRYKRTRDRVITAHVFIFFYARCASRAHNGVQIACGDVHEDSESWTRFRRTTRHYRTERGGNTTCTLDR